MKKLFLLCVLSFLSVFIFAQSIVIKLPDSLSKKPLDGRLLLVLSKNFSGEPRFQVNDNPSTQQIFGSDVENWRPGTTK
ncbi:MAG: hypothetical protein HC867_04880, partial [Bacteroidia bacterium]|nr:hypothetical protein [Bacteroidia bacterium]